MNLELQPLTEQPRFSYIAVLTGWESRFSDQENVLKMYPKTSYFQAE